MANTFMAEGDCTTLLPSFSVENGSPSQGYTGAVTDMEITSELGAVVSPCRFQSTHVGGSPGKYIPPRFRRSVSPASPGTVLSKRPLAVDEALIWRDNQTFTAANTPANVSSVPSPPNRSPPHKVQVTQWGLASFASPGHNSGQSATSEETTIGTGSLLYDGVVPPHPCKLQSASESPSARAPLVGPSASLPMPLPTESEAPATLAFRCMFRSACRASHTKEAFAGARIKHGRFLAAALSSSLQDHADRGVILSFSQRAPSYDHFRVWIESHLSLVGILIDDASQLGNDFFLLLLHDHANQQLALKQKLLFLNKYVDIFPWTPAFAPHELSNKTRPIWVELTNLHPSLRLRSTVEEVVTTNLGPVLYFPETETLVHHTNPRILIRWTMLEEIVDFLSLDDQGNILLQQVSFLNHPNCCHRCKRPGHLMKDCANQAHFRNDSRFRTGPSLPSADNAEEAPPPSSPILVPAPSEAPGPDVNGVSPGGPNQGLNSFSAETQHNSTLDTNPTASHAAGSVPNSPVLGNAGVVGLDADPLCVLNSRLPTSPSLPANLRIRTARTVQHTTVPTDPGQSTTDHNLTPSPSIPAVGHPMSSPPMYPLVSLPRATLLALSVGPTILRTPMVGTLFRCVRQVGEGRLFLHIFPCQQSVKGIAALRLLTLILIVPPT
ncbi:unnamed protein product [Calypogeia fissa]